MLKGLIELAETALLSGRTSEASRLARAALADPALRIPAERLLGIACAQSGETGEAVSLFESVLASAPNDYVALVWLSSLLRADRKAQRALEVGLRAVAITPDDSGARTIVGSCLMDLGRHADAIPHLEIAARSEPDATAIHRMLGECLRIGGQTNQAIKSYEIAASLSPTDPLPHIALADLYLDCGSRLRAGELYRKAHSLERHTARGQLSLARALTEEGKFEERDRALSKAASLDPRSGVALTMLGKIRQLQGRFDEAALLFEQALGRQPNLADAYLELASSTRVTDEHGSLVTRMQKALGEAEPDSTQARKLHYALGKAYDDLGLYSEAILHFDAANALMRNALRRPLDQNEFRAEVGRTIASYSMERLCRRVPNAPVSAIPVFIVGMIRSGTTLVEQILSRHPEVFDGGELSYWISEASAIPPYSEGWTDQVVVDKGNEYVEQLACMGAGYARVTDKMPLNFQHLGLLHLALPNAKIIHCRRSPVDTAVSIYVTPFSQPVGFAHDREAIVFFYRQYLRLMSHWRTTVPADSLLEVDYESLVDRPEGETRRLLAFLGLEWNQDCLTPESNPRVVQTPSTWQVRQRVYGGSKGRANNYAPWLGAIGELAAQYPVA